MFEAGKVNVDFFESIKKFPVQELAYDFDSNCINKIKDVVQKAGVLLLGEVHGVRENPLIIYTLVKVFGFKAVALEWPSDFEADLKKFLETGFLNLELISFKSDGTITAGHFAMLKKLYEEGLLESIILFDIPTTTSGDEISWNERDKIMSETLLLKKSKSTPTLVICGNKHSRMYKFELQDQYYHPFGMYLKNYLPKIQNALISYLSGTYFNSGIYNFLGEVRPQASLMLQFSRDEFHDFELILPFASAASVPSDENIS